MKQKIIATSLLGLLVATTSLFSQDSLKQLLNTSIPDTSRIDVLDQLSQQYYSIDLDSSILYSTQAHDLAIEINDLERTAYMLKNMGIAYYYKGEYLKVIENWTASLDIFRLINHPKGESNLLSNLGSVYNITGDYTKAIDHHLECLRIAEKTDDVLRKATVLQNIGAVYSNMEEYEKSREYYIQALDLCEELEYEKCIGLVNMNLSEVAREKGDYEEAKRFIQMAVNTFEKNNYPELPEAKINLSEISNLQENYSQALTEAQEGLQIALEKDTKGFVHRAHVVAGKALNGLGNHQKALSSFQKAADLQEGIGITGDLQEAFIGLKESYEYLGDYKNALLAQDSLIAINKHIYDNDKNKNISNLELTFNLEKKENEIALLNADVEKAQIQRNFFTAISLFLFMLIGGIGYMYQYSRKKNKIINEEKNKSDGLLKNILPPETAEELKKNGVVQPKRHEFTTVLFTDFVGFTKISSEHSPETIVSSVDYYFKEFDKIITRNQLEKIKTIGDAYMCAGGLHRFDSDSQLVTLNTLKAATEIIEFTRTTLAFPPEGIVTFEVRIGIDSGPVVAGVVGQTKFQYDIWGDTVNVASRMETNCEPNKINVSENVYDLIKSKQDFAFRGEIDVKNRGKMKMYYLNEVGAN